MVQSQGSRPREAFHLRQLVKNYRVMVDQVNILDKNRNTQIASDFFRTMASVNVPFVESRINSCQSEGYAIMAAETLRELRTEFNGLLEAIGPQETGYTGEGDDSPFLLLLRLAVHQGSIHFSKLQGNKDWEEMASFQGYLQTLGRNLVQIPVGDGTESYWPGLPSCVLAHCSTKPDGLRWNPVISASVDRYNDFGDRDQWPCQRLRQISRLEEKCPQDVVRRIAELRKISESFAKWVPPEDDRKRTGATTDYRHPSHCKDKLTGIPVNLPGIVATWRPNGDYMESCLLDHFRFHVRKPQSAKRRERSRKDSQRALYPVQSCAEWSGLLEWCACTRTWPTAYTSTRWPPPENSDVRIPSWPFRGWDEMPFSAYTMDIVDRRPDRYDVNIDIGAWEKLFPGLLLRKSVADGTLFGRPIQTQYAGIANLEGAAEAKSRLRLEEIVAGLAFSLQDMQNTIWISMLISWEHRSDHKFDVNTQNAIRTRRFHLWPVHLESGHWILAIYDREQDSVHWMDPWNSGNEQFGKEYRKFLKGFNITLHEDDPVTVKAVRVPRPHDDWTDGFHAIENARAFFREPLGQGLHARSWHESKACRKIRSNDLQISDADCESRMVEGWVRFARLELGHADRSPIRLSEN
ncbi:hypothetical protein F5Y10DRAFT_289679 [Nemania abortiva]|nr:hypothetical protein F5Y10DRAFT_289679 [Nemania abortiva]